MITSTPNTNPNFRPSDEGVLHSTDKAIDSARQSAHDAIGAAESKMQSFRSSVEPAVDKLANKAQQLAHQGMDAAVQVKDRAQESYIRYSDATSRYVTQQPVRSVLIAAAVGAVVALLLSPSRSSRSRRDE